MAFFIQHSPEDREVEKVRTRLLELLSETDMDRATMVRVAAEIQQLAADDRHLFDMAEYIAHTEYLVTGDELLQFTATWEGAARAAMARYGGEWDLMVDPLPPPPSQLSPRFARLRHPRGLMHELVAHARAGRDLAQ